MSAAGMEGMALGAGRALSEDSDDDGGGIKWEVASEASSDEAGEPHDVELPQEETLAPKPKKKPSRADVAEKRRLRGEKKEWRSRRVVVHQAQLVVFVARLRLLDSACDAEAARDAAVALLPGHLLQRLRAAARGESRAQLVGAVNGISKAAKAAVLEPSSKDRKRWRDTWGAAPAGLAARAISTRTASPAELAQLVCAACRACEVETRLVAGISPVVCAQSHASGCDVTAWLEARALVDVSEVYGAEPAYGVALENRLAD
ncbi:hypothetical protein M885DRAFT_574271 [Pelagophyceae sp. CCMP2097]|nr:hypothetical protein M885DRAFT_574271 [Pelagophyceae sp. CCMP2097]